MAALEFSGRRDTTAGTVAPPTDDQKEAAETEEADLLTELLGSPRLHEFWEAGEWVTEESWPKAPLSPPGQPVAVLPASDEVGGCEGGSCPDPLICAASSGRGRLSDAGAYLVPSWSVAPWSPLGRLATSSPAPDEVGGREEGSIPGPIACAAPGGRSGSTSPGPSQVGGAGAGSGMPGPRAGDREPSPVADVAMVPFQRGIRDVAALVIGDSMARRAGFAAPPPYDLTITARGGVSWYRDLSSIRRQVMSWVEQSRGKGQRLGPVMFWVGGNDMYPGPGGRRRPEPDLGSIGALLSEVAGMVTEVVVVGPTPRPAYDESRLWGATPAFDLDRKLKAVAGVPRVSFVSVGRRLCQWRNPAPRGYYVYMNRFFTSDRVHLSGEGYARLRDRLPNWLDISGSAPA